VGGALHDYNLISILKKQVDYCKKNVYRNQKSETQLTMWEMNK
jgi:hypothetical protein